MNCQYRDPRRRTKTYSNPLVVAWASDVVNLCGWSVIGSREWCMEAYVVVDTSATRTVTLRNEGEAENVAPTSIPC